MAFRNVDDAIGQLVGEKEGLEARVAELQVLLDEEARPTPVPSVAAAPAQAAVAEPLQANAEPEGRSGTTVVTPPVAASGSRRAGRAPGCRAGRSSRSLLQLEVSPKTERPASRPPVPTAATVRPAVRSAGWRRSNRLDLTGQTTDGPARRRRQPGTEPLLTAPVGSPQDERLGESLLAGVENSKLALGERPLAANVSANIPIVLRPTTSTEQTKTLKCNECGAMNYPTEWYCERCGCQ